LAGFIREQGAGLMVMACNSATAAAAPLLRTVHAGWPIVGMEPGVKPAVLASPSGRVGVMATTATLRSQRYARLLADHGSGAQVFAQACTGLAMAIEQGNEPLIRALVNEHTGPLLAAQVDTVVLGCTHYPFARGWIESSMGPGVHILDTADAVARRAASLILESREDDSGLTATRGDHGLPKAITADHSRPVDPDMRFWTSGEPAALNVFAQRWLGWSIKAEPLPRSAFAPGEAATNQ
jgi:glutamate racemase